MKKQKRDIKKRVGLRIVRKGMAQCLNAEQIRQLLEKKNISVTERTVMRYISEVKDELRKEIKKSQMSIEDILQEFYLSYDETYAELWRLYRDPEVPKTHKVKILKSIAEHRKEKLEYLQSLGVMRKEPESLDIKHSGISIELFNKAYEELRKGKGTAKKP